MCLGDLSAICGLRSMIVRVNKSQSRNILIVHSKAVLMIFNTMK